MEFPSLNVKDKKNLLGEKKDHCPVRTCPRFQTMVRHQNSTILNFIVPLSFWSMLQGQAAPKSTTEIAMKFLKLQVGFGYI